MTCAVHAEEGQRLVAVRQATFVMLRRRPEALVLGVQADGVVYTSTPGESVTLPVNGSWIVADRGRTPGAHPESSGTAPGSGWST